MPDEKTMPNNEKCSAGHVMCEGERRLERGVHLTYCNKHDKFDGHCSEGTPIGQDCREAPSSSGRFVTRIDDDTGETLVERPQPEKGAMEGSSATTRRIRIEQYFPSHEAKVGEMLVLYETIHAKDEELKMVHSRMEWTLDAHAKLCVQHADAEAKVTELEAENGRLIAAGNAMQEEIYDSQAVDAPPDTNACNEWFKTITPNPDPKHPQKWPGDSTQPPPEGS